LTSSVQKIGEKLFVLTVKKNCVCCDEPNKKAYTAAILLKMKGLRRNDDAMENFGWYSNKTLDFTAFFG
jgi:hypothetical protein